MPATITDVASRARVSVATVSRVLNRNYPVAEATQARVLAAVRELGYVANAHARALVKATSGTVGVILHDIGDPYFAEIVQGIQEAAEEHERLVVLCSSQRDPSREITYIETLRAQRVDAVILTSGYVEDEQFLQALGEQARGLRAQGGTLVVCGQYPFRAPAVVPDNVGGANEITSHLLRLGHRRIAHLSGPPRFSTSDDRLRGYTGACHSYGIGPDPALVINGDFSRDGGYDACRRLVNSAAAFTAIFAANDLMAIGAFAALREAGLRVPEDVSLVGFDDIRISRDLTPPLTTVAVPMGLIGREALRLAVAPDPERDNVVRVPVHVIERASTTAPGRTPSD